MNDIDKAKTEKLLEHICGGPKVDYSEEECERLLCLIRDESPTIEASSLEEAIGKMVLDSMGE